MQVKRIMASNSRFHLLWMTSTSLTITLLLTTQVVAGYGYNFGTPLYDVMPINVNHTINNNFEYEYEVRICVLEIASGDIGSALNTYRKLQDNRNYDTLRTIIKHTYDKNVQNIPNLLKFVIKLPDNYQMSAGFDLLVQILRWNTQASFQLAYHLKQIEEMPINPYADVNPNVRWKLSDMKNSIPVGIKTIIWQQSNLCLKNTYNKEYLYTAACCRYDSNRRRLFSWIPQGDIGPQGAFTFEPIKDGTLFKIKSDYYQEYIHAAACCPYDKDNRNVVTWTSTGDVGPQGEWTLELVNDSNLLRIRNNYSDEYLYAADCCLYDGKRRNIFTWIPKGEMGIMGEWEIESC